MKSCRLRRRPFVKLYRSQCGADALQTAPRRQFFITRVVHSDFINLKK